ncbi:MAG: hypothetical protein J2P24_02670 [Streptosporangiales bacterium]|nr:hypothetical protein [Streptosporangiales bacterium]
MGITVSELKNVNTLDISYASGDFANASSWYGDALESFATDVLAKVDNDAVWSGGGQPDAATVMSINRSALNIGKIEMDAASKVLDALYSALGTAQGYLLASLYEANQKNMNVAEDGTTTADPSRQPVNNFGAPVGSNPDSDDAARIERELKGQLIFAAIADATCKSVLDRIASHTPSYSSTADPSVLALNMQTLEDATDDQTLAYNNQRFWQSAYPKALPEQPSGWDNFWHGVGNFFSHAWDNPGDVMHVVGDGALMFGGALLADASAGLVGAGGVLDLGVVTIPAGVAVSAVGVAGVVAGGGIVLAAAGDAGSTLSKMNSEAQSEGGSGDPASTNPEPPRYRPGDNKIRTRTYGKSTSDVQGQAKNYAKGMEQRGYKVDVPRVREGKYGGPDVTVAVYKKTGELVAIRHFIVKG